LRKEQTKAARGKMTLESLDWCDICEPAAAALDYAAMPDDVSGIVREQWWPAATSGTSGRTPVWP
jgi:hypothetical protein